MLALTRQEMVCIDEEKDREMVANLLEFKARLDTVLSEAFAKSEALVNTTKESFEQFINLRRCERNLRTRRIPAVHQMPI